MAEVNETSNVVNKPGIYVDPESGAEIIAKNHAKFGSAQADAAVRVGYVFDRPLPKESEQDNQDNNKKK
jgi:hypothetical protein